MRRRSSYSVSRDRTGPPRGLVELAGAIAELARHGMEKEFRNFDPASARILLVQAGPRVLIEGEPGRRAATATFTRPAEFPDLNRDLLPNAPRASLHAKIL